MRAYALIAWFLGGSLLALLGAIRLLYCLRRDRRRER